MVVKLVCDSCGTEVNGEFDVCPVCTLEEESRELFDLFMEARGISRKCREGWACPIPPPDRE